MTTRRGPTIRMRRTVSYGTVALWAIGLAAAIVWVSPFLLMVTASLAPTSSTGMEQWLPPELTLDNYLYVLDHYPVARWALNSVIVTTGATIAALVVGAMAGYALARLRFPGRT